jgi:L-ascorbate metabolism protein UlaG (beta-lactamase superfamily)
MYGGVKVEETRIWFRWLGVAGIELQVNEKILAVDPFVTRPPMRHMWYGRVTPNRALIEDKIRHCDYVLVTHAHWDHAMDVPDVIRSTGAIALGSANTCRLLAACGVPGKKVREIKSGDQITLGEFRVEALPARHIRIPGFSPGPLPTTLRPPLRLRDYRMDSCFNFLIKAAGLCLLDWSSIRPEPAPRAEVLFVRLYGEQAYYEALLDRVRPRLVIPVHWDDLFRPLSRPARPFFKPPGRAFPPLQHMDPTRFKTMIEDMATGVKVLIPEMFRVYDLRGLSRDTTLLKKPGV